MRRVEHKATTIYPLMLTFFIAGLAPIASIIAVGLLPFVVGLMRRIAAVKNA